MQLSKVDRRLHHEVLLANIAVLERQDGAAVLVGNFFVEDLRRRLLAALDSTGSKPSQCKQLAHLEDLGACDLSAAPSIV